MRTPTATSRTHAFTLVEVMMAATLLVVGFIGMIQAVVIGAGMMDNARRQTLAAQILGHEMDELRAASWATINALPTASTTLTIDPQFTPAINASGATFTLTRSVTSPDPATNLREVNFTITWVVKTSRRNPQGSLLTFTFSRSTSGYFGKYGLNLSYQRS